MIKIVKEEIEIDEYNLEKSQNEIIKFFSNKLTKQFGQGFSVPSLKKMKKFYQVFNGGSTVWNHLFLNPKILQQFDMNHYICYN